MSLGENIARLRKELGMTQEQLAEKCEVSRQAVTKWERGDSEPTISKLINLSKELNVSIDSLVTGEKVPESSKEEKNISEWDWNYSRLSFLIQWIISTEYLDLVDMGIAKNMILNKLYSVVKTRFINPENKIYEKYLVKNTSKKQRKNYIEQLNGSWSDKEGPFEGYINGECEVDEGFKAIEEQMDRESKERYKLSAVKGKTRISKSFNRLSNTFLSLTGIEECNEQEYRKLVDRLHEIMDKLPNQDFIDRFISFYCHEAENALARRDTALLEELAADWYPDGLLHDYVWNKIKVEVDDDEY